MIRETGSEVEVRKGGMDGLVVWEVSLRGGQVRKFMHLARVGRRPKSDVSHVGRVRILRQEQV